MKYIRPFFEKAPTRSRLANLDEFEEHREEMVPVLTKYCKLYKDDLYDQIRDWMWEYEDTSNRLDDIVNEIDEECIRMLVDNISQDRFGREKGKFCDLFYDCYQVLKGDVSDLHDSIVDIFSEYKDKYKVYIKKSSDFGDNRYVVRISGRDVVTEISFIEIINRVMDIGIERYEYEGNSEYIEFQFCKDLPKDDEENIDIELEEGFE